MSQLEFGFYGDVHATAQNRFRAGMDRRAQGAAGEGEGVHERARPEFEPYRKRMDWHFKWVSSNGSDFNRDYHVSFTKEDIADGNTMYNYKADGKTIEGEAHGISVFYKDERSDIFHTYSSYARCGDLLIGAYNYLDLMPKGRNEESELSGWVRRHDEYEP
jgi:predicted dithiol-disulfide oxidoreductase (DUF899 family)